MPGPKPKPSVLKKLQGTYRADRVVPNEARFDVPIRMPSPPEELSEDGAKLWRSVGKMLLHAGLYTAGDFIALELMCMAYGRMKEAERLMADEMVLKSAQGGYYQSPYLSIVNRSWEMVRSMLAEFGMTPAERTRVMSTGDNHREVDLADQLFAEVRNSG